MLFVVVARYSAWGTYGQTRWQTQKLAQHWCGFWGNLASTWRVSGDLLTAQPACMISALLHTLHT